MAIRLITFDCARTLLDVDWDPIAFALRSARRAGLELPEDAGARYAKLLTERYAEVLTANRTGHYPTVQEAYRRIGAVWMAECGLPEDSIDRVIEASEVILLDPREGLFLPYDDVVDTLSALRQRGVKLAVVSNWDASLELVLKAHQLDTYFDAIFASLVVGAEKPDPTMLNLAMKQFDVSAEETLHVGDDETDDLGVAENAGTQGVLIDRSRASEPPIRIQSLREVLAWTA